MKKLMILATSMLSILVVVWACVPTDNKVDVSNCSESFNWHLMMLAPLASDGNWNSELVYKIDSLMPGDTFTAIDIDQVGYRDELAIGLSEKPYYKQYFTAFTCNKAQDTCWYMEMNASPGYSFMHEDTISWSVNSGGSTGLGDAIQCTLDSSGGVYYNDLTGVKDSWTFNKDIVLLDTFSVPARRSMYKQWWPLPRIPWAQGESVWADSAIWGANPTMPKE